MERRHAEGAANRGQLSVARAMVDWAEDVLDWAREGGGPRSAPFEVQVFRLGEAALIAMSGEVFMAYSDNLRARSPFPHTLALGYSNGCVGYVPTAAAYPEGGYEVATAYRYYDTLMLDPGCERRILDATEDIMRALAG
jgi:neutral ceramidase